MCGQNEDLLLWLFCGKKCVHCDLKVERMQEERQERRLNRELEISDKAWEKG